MRADWPEEVNSDLSIEQVIERWPQTVPVFVRRRMHCAGCAIARFETVAEACHIYGQPLGAVLAELRQAVQDGPARPQDQ